MRSTLVLFLLTALPCYGQTVPPQPPADAVIHMPPEVGPSPTPVAPGGATKLPPDVMMVISSNTQFVVLGSPDALVSVEQFDGPANFHGKFVEDPAKTVMRKISDKYITVVKSAGTGRCEIIVVPLGLQKASDVIRRLVDCENGPQPPPVPPAPVSPFTAALQAAYAADPGLDKVKSLAFLTAAYQSMATSVPLTAKTNLDVLNWMKGVVEAPGVGLSSNQLIGVRQTVSTHLANTFGVAAGAPADRTKVSEELAAIANALSGVH